MKGTERTQVDDVTLKIIELCPIDGECGNVASVVAVVNPDGDLGSPVDITEPAAVGILPLGLDFGEEHLERALSSFLASKAICLRPRAVLFFPPNFNPKSANSPASLTASRNPVLTASSISTTARARRRSPQTRMC